MDTDDMIREATGGEATDPPPWVPHSLADEFAGTGLTEDDVWLAVHRWIADTTRLLSFEGYKRIQGQRAAAAARKAANAARANEADLYVI